MKYVVFNLNHLLIFVFTKLQSSYEIKIDTYKQIHIFQTGVENPFFNKQKEYKLKN